MEACQAFTVGAARWQTTRLQLPLAGVNPILNSRVEPRAFRHAWVGQPFEYFWHTENRVKHMMYRGASGPAGRFDARNQCLDLLSSAGAFISVGCHL